MFRRKDFCLSASVDLQSLENVYIISHSSFNSSWPLNIGLFTIWKNWKKSHTHTPDIILLYLLYATEDYELESLLVNYSATFHFTTQYLKKNNIDVDCRLSFFFSQRISFASYFLTYVHWVWQLTFKKNGMELRRCKSDHLWEDIDVKNAHQQETPDFYSLCFECSCFWILQLRCPYLDQSHISRSLSKSWKSRLVASTEFPIMII